jgi:LmbE family N-acetylglucosaminyl deacetylase
MNQKIARTLLAFLLVSLLVTLHQAQQPSLASSQLIDPLVATRVSDTSEDRIALYQALLDLQNPWTVMCVAAHPDDEDGTSLVVMRHKYGAHTVSLFSTFGEGGQNAIGPELYEEMGAIRARETMAAAEIQGSEPHFLGLKDFGFSKTRDEAFKFWGHEEALRRMVLEIRKLRPDVIITNHSTTSNDHGQHQATALMVVEAFDAAADPNKFPEQLRDGLTTWQVQRLFVRARGNQQQAANTSIVTIDPNEKDPVRGVVYAEEALRALQQHATQGPWPKSFAEYANRFRAFSGQPAGTPGQLPMIRYALVKSANGAAGVPAQASHNFLDGLQLPPAVAQQLPLPDLTTPDDALKDPSRTREAIVETYRKGNYGSPSSGFADPQRHELMRRKMEVAAALISGLRIDAQLPAKTVIANSNLSVPIKIANGGTERVTLTNCGSGAASELAENRASDVRVNHSRLTTERPLSPGASFTVTDKVQIPGDAKINVPLAEHLYEPTALGLNLNLRCEYEIDQTKLGIDLPVRVDVAPPVEIARVSANPFVIRRDFDRLTEAPSALTVELINHRNEPFRGTLGAFVGDEGEGLPINLPPLGNESIKITAARLLSFRGQGAKPPKRINLRVRNGGTSVVSESIPFVLVEARVNSNLRVGYIRGFDFSLPNALNALGVESKELSVDDVKMTDLSKFTSVIVDNRVYESKPELIAVNQKLLDYANAGGTLIVFYHKSDEWNPDERRNRPQLAPYKLILGGERVTDENAPITFIEPDHPLLNTPNKMGQDDFRDWIQERGLYYPRDWDPQFQALLQSNDPGEQPLKGGLLVADYGKGHYIYTSMVWYRELRGGIPGAYRMLANMISYGRS